MQVHNAGKACSYCFCIGKLPSLTHIGAPPETQAGGENVYTNHLQMSSKKILDIA